MSRRSGAVFFVFAATVGLAACGSGGSNSAASTTASTPSTTSPTTTAPPATDTTATTIVGGAGGATTLPGQTAGAGTVTSVVFTGSAANPTVTVTGTGLGGLPSPNPTYTPEGHQLCPLPPSGNQGYDYGVRFYLSDPARNWSGGRYRPELGELDCIGLISPTFSPTKVVFTFGSAYMQYQQKYNYLLAEGDPYQLVVNGVALQGTVHYTTG